METYITGTGQRIKVHNKSDCEDNIVVSIIHLITI